MCPGGYMHACVCATSACTGELEKRPKLLFLKAAHSPEGGGVTGSTSAWVTTLMLVASAGSAILGKHERTSLLSASIVNGACHRLILAKDHRAKQPHNVYKTTCCTVGSAPKIQAQGCQHQVRRLQPSPVDVRELASTRVSNALLREDCPTSSYAMKK